MQIILNLNNINSSAQVGDSVYYCTLNLQTDNVPLGGFDTADYTDIVRIGTISSIGLNNVRVNIDEAVPMPTENDFVFFSKDNIINTGDLKGYFAEVKFINNSNKEAELFQISMGVEQSSK